MSEAKHRASDPVGEADPKAETLNNELRNAEAAQKLQQSEAQVKETAHDIERDLK